MVERFDELDYLRLSQIQSLQGFNQVSELRNAFSKPDRTMDSGSPLWPRAEGLLQGQRVP